MLLLPEQGALIKPGLEKIDTYLTLAKINCPVLKSALIFPKEKVTVQTINNLKKYFETEEVTVRYQYIKPSTSPIQGGNRYKLSLKTIAELQNEETILWILEPINRFKNNFGINLYFNTDVCTIEIVGKGFDVSDLNRGQICPHQSILTNLPIQKGYFNEWWKYLKFSFCSPEEYERSKIKRTKKLLNMGYTDTSNLYDTKYSPLPFEQLNKLLEYITSIYNNISENNYCVSCSIVDNKFVFWDIQTPNGKKRTYGV